MPRKPDLAQALAPLQARITSILALLRAPQPSPSSSPASTSTPPPPPIAAVRSDLIALLGLLSKESTNLTLALKPPVSGAAVLGTVDKVREALDKVGFLAEQCPREAGALAKQINWTTQESLENLSHLLSAAAQALSAPPASANSTREGVLRAAKAFWAACDRAAKELPADELEAVRRGWRDTLGLLDDCLDEVAELAAGGGEEDDDDEEEEEEDDDDDDGLTTPSQRAALTSQELARIDAARLLLRLSRLLLNRLLTTTTPTSPPPPSPSPSSSSATPAGLTTPAFLAASRPLVSQLSALADDLALALSPPQDGTALGEVSRALCGATDRLAGAMEEAAAASSDERERAGEGEREEREKEKEREGEWFKMWRVQRDAARKRLDEAI
ncbi:hypothetical protein JCM1840_006834 [Sporobolomyces johnsonii]